MSSIASFRAKLEPLSAHLDDPAVTEIAINQPGEAWLGRRGQRHMSRVEIPALDLDRLSSLAQLTAAYTQQTTDDTRPLLSATIPINLADGVSESQRGGYRIQAVKPPAVQPHAFGLCIRKPALLDLGLADYAKSGAFEFTNRPVVEDEECSEARLRELYAARDWEQFLRAAVRAHKNIVISAGTNTGKTTFLNALLKEIDPRERIVTIQDSAEVRVAQPNCLNLLYSRGDQGVAKVDAVHLLEACLRLTPDRVVMGELRGSETYAYLELLNTGHSGSITTIHADSPTLMFDRLAQMVMRFGAQLTKPQIIEYARTLIPVVVQMRLSQSGGRLISEIHYAQV